MSRIVNLYTTKQEDVSLSEAYKIFIEYKKAQKCAEYTIRDYEMTESLFQRGVTETMKCGYDNVIFYCNIDVCLLYCVNIIKKEKSRMAISYSKLWKLLIDKKMKQVDLLEAANISSNLLARLGHDGPVSMDSIEKICRTLYCNIGDVMEFMIEE